MTVEPEQQYKSIAKQIGRKQIFSIAWEATPLPWKLFTPVYSGRVLGELLERTATLGDFYISHKEMYQRSGFYRLGRARYEVVNRRLRAMGIE